MIFLLASCKTILSSQSQTSSTKSQDQGFPVGQEIFGLENDEYLEISLVSTNIGELTDWDEKFQFYLETDAILWYTTTFNTKDREIKHGKLSGLLEIERNTDPSQQVRDIQTIKYHGSLLNEFFNIEKRHMDKLRSHGTDKNWIRAYVYDPDPKIYFRLWEKDKFFSDRIKGYTFDKSHVEKARSHPNQTYLIENLDGGKGISYSVQIKITKTPIEELLNPTEEQKLQIHLNKTNIPKGQYIFGVEDYEKLEIILTSNDNPSNGKYYLEAFANVNYVQNNPQTLAAYQEKSSQILRSNHITYDQYSQATGEIHPSQIITFLGHQTNVFFGVEKELEAKLFNSRLHETPNRETIEQVNRTLVLRVFEQNSPTKPLGEIRLAREQIVEIFKLEGHKGFFEIPGSNGVLFSVGLRISNQ